MLGAITGTGGLFVLLAKLHEAGLL
jgi:hypothetical protein